MTFIKLKWTLVLWLWMLPFSGFGQGGRSQQDSLALLLQKGTELIRQQNYEVLEQIISKGNTLLKQNQSTLSFSLIADFQSLTGRFYLLTHQEERWDDLYSWVVEHETQFKSQEDLGILVRLYNNAGIAFKRLSRLTDSQLAYLKASNALKKLGKPNYLLEGSIYNNAGNVIKQLGEYDKAITYLNQAITSLNRLVNTATDPSPSNLSLAYSFKSQALNNLGLIYQFLNNHQKAIAAFQEALRLKRKYDPAGVTMVASNMANSYIELNQLTEAELLTKEVLSFYGSNKPMDRIGLQALINKADLILKLHRDTNLFYNEIERITRFIQNSFSQSGDLLTTITLMKAEVLHQQDRHEQGIALVDLCLEEIEKSKSLSFSKFEVPMNYRTNYDKEFIALMNMRSYLLMGLGEERRDPGIEKHALQSFDFTAKLIDSINLSLQDQSSRIELSRTQRTTFNGLISLTYSLFKSTGDSLYIDRCFYYMERSKGSGLMSSILESDLKASRIPESKLLEEHKIRTRVTDLTGQIIAERASTLPDAEIISALEEERFTINLKLDSLLREFRHFYPDYYAMKFESPILDLKDAMRLLSPGQALLQYSITGQQLIILLFDNLGVEIHNVRLTLELESQIRFLTDFVTGQRSSFSRGKQAEFIRTGHDLFRSLVPRGNRFASCRQLTIIPEGILSHIPFEVLLTERVPDGLQGYRSMPYLLKSKTITYANSATLLFYQSGKPNRIRGQILAIAPDYEVDPSNASDMIRNHTEQLPVLNGAIDEVKAIRRITGGKVLVGQSASEGRFKQLSPNYGILHLAMHTITDRYNPMNTCLVFTPGEKGKEDGLLYAHELYNSSWKASLAVLSACETGSGQMVTGEGILSLARGFIFAGCPNLIMTMWPVDDLSSQEVMEHFYQAIWSGEALADALGQAKLRYLESADKLHAHPHFWAGYLFLGSNTPSPVTPQPARFWLAIPVIVSFLALLVLFLFLFRFIRKP